MLYLLIKNKKNELEVISPSTCTAVIKIVSSNVATNTNDTTYLPPFDADTMYKGMRLDKEYSLKELGLDE